MKLNISTLLLFLILLVLTVSAAAHPQLNLTPAAAATQTNTSDPLFVVDNNTQEEFTQLTGYTGTWGAILIATGLVLVFFGHKLFKPLLFLGGFYFLGALTFVIMQNIESNRTDPFHNRDLIYFLCCLIFGLVGGGLALFFWRFAFGAIGACLGYAVALLLLTALSGVFTSQIGRWILVVVCCLLFSGLIFWFETPILMAATSLGGSYATFAGLDMFVRTGFIGIAMHVTRGDRNSQEGAGNGWIWMLVGCVALALVGLACQMRSLKKSGGAHACSKREMRQSGGAGQGFIVSGGRM
ncbi:hypothetical protein HDU98_000868 [Podochytrium sp. JEL0797]|nr:hypothetical protein HDU98_000868 [Podochytrium sp. JEL0797]